MIASSWNTTDAARCGVLSNGNLTLTTNKATGWSTARSTNSISGTAKVYVEFYYPTAKTTAAMIGFANASFANSGSLGGGNYSGAVYPAGGINQVSTGFASMYNPSPTHSNTNGDVYGLAIDYTAARIWASVNGVWFSPGNPSTNTSPIITFTPGTVGALFPAVSFNTNSATGDICTLQFTPASQKYAAPSGFTAMDAPPVQIGAAALAIGV